MITGPGVLFRLRAGGSTPGLTFTRTAATATMLSNAGVLSTAAANILRTSWFDADGDGVLETPGFWLEPAAINIALWSRDLTQAGSWTKVSTTAALTQTGVDGTASSASLITATAGNGTILQTVASASASRSFSAFVRRVTGSGVINMTMDNGATWTAISVTNSWKRFTIPTQVVVNPVIGFRIVTNTDAIAVDYCQLESTTITTSPILTTTTSATRNADNLSASFPYRPCAMTLYAKYIAEHVSSGSDTAIIQIGTSAGTNPRVYLGATGGPGTPNITITNLAGTAKSSTATGVPTNGQVVEIRGVVNSDGSVLVGQSIAGAAETLGSTSATQTLEAAWNATNITLGSGGAVAAHAMGLIYALVLSGVRSMDSCRALV